MKRVQPRTPLTRVIATNIKEYFPPLLRLLFTLVREKRDGDRVDARARRPRTRATCCARIAARPSTRAAITPDDPAVLLMSGGTTGTPKGVLGTHGAYVIAGLQVQAWMQSVLGDGDSVILLPLPLFHVYANVGVQALALVTGNPLALVPNPRDIARSARDDPPRQAGVLQRRADAVHRAAQPSRRADAARSTSSRSRSASRAPRR